MTTAGPKSPCKRAGFESTSTRSSSGCGEELAGGANGRTATAARCSRARHRAERLWAVSAERPLERRPGPKGWVAYPLKKLLRPFLRWYVEPLAARAADVQRRVLKMVDGLARGGRPRRALARGGGAHPGRARGAADAHRAPRRRRGARDGRRRSPPQAAFPDYFAFEAKMRGSTADVRERQRLYVDDFRDAAPVLDVGCGRGELLGLLRDAGIEAQGVDADADMVAYARGEGLDVEQADALAYLEALPDGDARRDLRRPGRRAPPARRARSASSSSPRRSSAPAACSSRRRSTRSRRSRSAPTSPT